MNTPVGGHAGAFPPRRVVLLGHPVSHSLSPAFQNAALAAAGVAARYEALDVSPGELPALLRVLRIERAAGNVTIPHKQALFARCDVCTPLALRVGAVNTFWHTIDGALVGDNTDVGGFERATDALGVERTSASVLCIGAGGAAAALCAAVSTWKGSTIMIAARRNEQAATLVDRTPGARLHRGNNGANATLVVNTTPVGLNDDALPYPIERIPRDAGVMDMVYRRGETAWVRAARAAGLRACDGREMLFQQGALSFERWLGVPPNLTIMRIALERALES